MHVHHIVNQLCDCRRKVLSHIIYTFYHFYSSVETETPDRRMKKSQRLASRQHASLPDMAASKLEIWWLCES